MDGLTPTDIVVTISSAAVLDDYARGKLERLETALKGEADTRVALEPLDTPSAQTPGDSGSNSGGPSYTPMSPNVSSASASNPPSGFHCELPTAGFFSDFFDATLAELSSSLGTITPVLLFLLKGYSTAIRLF